MIVIAQAAADLDVWRHPVVLLVIGVLLTAIATGVSFALKSILTGQKLQDQRLIDLDQKLAVRNAVDLGEAMHAEQRMQRIESDISSVRTDVGALHKRLDDTLITRLAAGNPEVRP